MTTTTKTTRKYEIAVSRNEYAPNGWWPKESGIHGFSFYSYGQFTRVPEAVIDNAHRERLDLREAVIAWADSKYGPKVYTENGSYQLRETTHTVTVAEETSKTESLKSRIETTQVVIFHESFRTQEQMEEFYLKPLREWEAKAPEREAEHARIDALIEQRRAAEEAERIAALSPLGRLKERVLASVK